MKREAEEDWGDSDNRLRYIVSIIPPSGCKMGFWKRLFGSTDIDDVLNKTLRSIERSAILNAPHDKALWDQAYAAKNHISLKAVDDEYCRLILEKYGPK
jgi:hypothetical protein